MATIRELFVKVGADIGDFTRNMVSAAQSAGRFGESVQASSRVVQQSSQLSALEVSRAASKYDEQYGKMGRRAKEAASDIEDANNRAGTSAGNFSRRMNSVSVGVLFAFDAMTRSAQAGEGAWRRVFRSMSLLALTVFDPPAGLIIAGILAGTDAIIDAFSRQERAAEKARRTFIEASIEIARSGDIIRASQQKALVFSGDPFALRGQGKNAVTGEEVPASETETAFQVRRRGVLALAGLQDDLNKKIAEQGKMISVQDRLAAEHYTLLTAIMPPQVRAYAELIKQQRELNILAAQYTDLNKQAGETFDIVNKKTADMAQSMLEMWQNTKLPRDVASEAERLVAIYDMLNKKHADTADMAHVVVTAYDRVIEQLTKLRSEGKTAFDPLIEGLLRAQETLENSDVIRLLRLNKGVPLAFPTLAAQQPGALAMQGAEPTATGGGSRVALPITQMDAQDLIGALLRKLAATIPAMSAAEFADAQRRGALGGVTGAAQPTIDAGRLNNLLGATLGNVVSRLGDDLKTQLIGTLVASFGPVSILMHALEPALRVLQPLFDRLAVPIALVAQVLVAALLPVIRALYPLLRLFGIAITFIGEVIARVAAAISQAVGGLVKAIGNLIAHIPGLGGVGHAIANFGQSILNFAAGQKAAADQMAAARRQLEGMSWDGTAQALDNLQGAAQNAADALTNIPSGYRIQRAIFLASRPVNAAADVGAGPNSSASGATNYFAPGSIVIVGSTKTGAQLLDDVTKAARQTAMARTGSTADAASVIG